MSTLVVQNITGLASPNVTTIFDRANAAVSNGQSLFAATIQTTKEAMKLIATSLTANVNVDLVDSTLQYFTANSTGRWNVNARGNSTTMLDAMVPANTALTFTLLVPQGATAYNAQTFLVDSNPVSVKWAGGSLANGTSNSVESYTYTMVKLAANTWTVLGSKGSFA